MTVSLGFIETVAPKFIFVGTKAPNSPWYFWDKEANAAIPITKTTLACNLDKIEIVEKEFKGKKYPKMLLSVNAGEVSYRLVSGIDTWFTKSLIIRLAQLDEINLSSVVYINANIGTTDEKVIFASLQNAQKEWVKRPETFDYKDYTSELITEHIQLIANKLANKQIVVDRELIEYLTDPETGEVVKREPNPEVLEHELF